MARKNRDITRHYSRAQFVANFVGLEFQVIWNREV